MVMVVEEEWHRRCQAFGLYSDCACLPILVLLGALALVNQSPLMGCMYELFVNRNTPCDQDIIGFLSKDSFLRRCRLFQCCHQIFLRRSLSMSMLMLAITYILAGREWGRQGERDFWTLVCRGIKLWRAKGRYASIQMKVCGRWFVFT